MNKHRFTALFAFLMLCFSTHQTYAQIIVKGQVLDEEGLSIPGITVLLEDTKTGTITDVDGRYSIEANIGSKLTFSYVGMETITREVTGAVLDVTMKYSVEGLEEVVVIGYGQTTKKELTGAVSQIKAKDIDQFVTADLGSALQGQMAGVNVIQSGQPGQPSEILIRGVTSLTGSNTPLFVVDGIPMDEDPQLAPNEIESIDVLKDAATASIYGVNGARGVILITTKRGQAGELKVSLDANHSIQKITSFLPLMDAEQQLYYDLTSTKNQQGTPDDLVTLGILRTPGGLTNNTDLFDLVIEDLAPASRFNLSVSGGNKQLKFNAVAGYFNQKGVLINSKFERLNARINTTYENGKWSVFSSVGAVLEEQNSASGALIQQTIAYNPTNVAIDPAETNNTIDAAGGVESTRLNWVLESLQNTDVDRISKGISNLRIGYEPIEDLRITGQFGANASNSFQRLYDPFQITTNLAQGTQLNDPESSGITNATIRRLSLTYNTVIDYTKKFGRHKMTLTAGQQYENHVLEQFEVSRGGLTSNSLQVLNATNGNIRVESGPDRETTRIGFFGRAQYGFAGKYLLNASLRQDWSSRFGQDKSAIFGGISTAWVVSDEVFWEPISSVVNSLKIRANYGTTGNDGIQDYQFASTIGISRDYLFGVGGTANDEELFPGATQSNFANSNIRWEIGTQRNIGIDASFLDNRVLLTAELYQKDQRDMLVNLATPGSAGAQGAQTTVNLGDMYNRGIELELTFREQIGDLGIRLTGTYTRNSNKITDIAIEGSGIIPIGGGSLVARSVDNSQITYFAEGYEAGAFFIYQTAGVIDTSEKLAAYQQLNAAARMGDLIYVDTNNDGVLSDDDRVFAGSGLPEFETGLNLTLNYRNFDLAMNWYGAFGQEIMNGSDAMAFNFGRHRDLLYGWSQANPDSPIPGSNLADNHHGHTDRWIEDGSYMRLKTFSLGYTVPSELINVIGMNSMRWYLTAQNPITITKYDGFDPEIGGGINRRGLDRGNYPVTAMYILGVTIQF